MPHASRTFRVFVSSTFSDFKEERNALQQYVFPRLRDLAAEQNCRFQAIDLRWGVSEEAGLDQQAMKICLGEIERCQKTGLRPNFIVLLGDRYGWQPLPSTIPAGEFDVLLRFTSDAEQSQLLWDDKQPDRRGWYQLDENAIPPEYVLRPRLPGTPCEDYLTWANQVQGPLRATLARAATQALAGGSLAGEALADEALAGDLLRKYTCSATGEEIEAGALSVAGASEHVFAFFRTITNLPELRADLPNDAARAKDAPKAEDFIDVDEHGQPDGAAKQRLEELKGRLAACLGGKPSASFDSVWQDGRLSTAHIGALPDTLAECLALQPSGRPPTLCEAAWLGLLKVMLAEAAKIKQVSEIDREIEVNDDFAREVRRNFAGRDHALGQIAAYLDSDENRPLAVTGETGSGKSALVARAAEQARDRLGPSAVVVATRFIGATPGSSAIRTLLKGLCEQIARDYGVPSAAIPSAYIDLVPELIRQLSHATAEKPLVLFTDALDQLSVDDDAQALDWLPRTLPPYVKWVVSCGPGRCLDEINRRRAEHARAGGPVSGLIEIDRLSEGEGEQVLEAWLNGLASPRRLQDDQKRYVLSRFAAAGSPLYLRLALAEAARWKSYDPIPALPDTLQGMVTALYERLERPETHGKTLVRAALGLIAASRDGLSEDELLDLLSADQEVMQDVVSKTRHPLEQPRLPVVLWSRLLAALEPYLNEREHAGAVLHAFFHNTLREGAAGRYGEGPRKKAYHAALAKYFDDGARTSPGGPWNPGRARALDVLLYHEAGAEQWDDAARILTDFGFLRSRLAAWSVFHLQADFDTVLRAMPARSGRKMASAGRKVLAPLQDALRVDANFIDRHTETLFQCLWNRCWWREESAGLRDLLRAWREQQAAVSGGHAWVRCLRPPGDDAERDQRVLAGHQGAVWCVDVSPDGRLIASGGFDCTVRVWNADSGRQLTCLQTNGRITTVHFSADGQYLAASGLDGFVHILNPQTGLSIKQIREPSDAIWSAAFAPGGERVAYGTQAGLIRIRDWASGERAGELRDAAGGGEVNWLAFSPDGAWLAAALRNGAWLWDLRAADRPARQLAAAETTAAAFSPDGVRLAFAAGPIHVLDLADGTASSLPAAGGLIRSLAFTPGGRQLILGMENGAITLVDATTVEEHGSLPGHTERVEGVAAFGDGARIATASDDCTVRVWSLQAAARGPHDGKPAALPEQYGFTPDGRYLTFLRDGSVILADPETGTERFARTAPGATLLRYALSPDSKVLYGVTDSGTLCSFTLGRAGPPRIVGTCGAAYSMGISATGERLAIGRGDGSVAVWDTLTGTEVGVYTSSHAMTLPVHSVALTAGASFVAGGLYDGTVVVWEAASGIEWFNSAPAAARKLGMFSLDQHNFVTALAFTPDGSHLVGSTTSSGFMFLQDWAIAEPQLDMLQPSPSQSTMVRTRDLLARFAPGDYPEAGERKVLSCDPRAAAEGPAKHPYTAYGDLLETHVVASASNQVLGRFPASYASIASHPDGRTWVGTRGGRMDILRLEFEGEPLAPPAGAVPPAGDMPATPREPEAPVRDRPAGAVRAAGMDEERRAQLRARAATVGLVGFALVMLGLAANTWATGLGISKPVAWLAAGVGLVLAVGGVLVATPTSSEPGSGAPEPGWDGRQGGSLLQQGKRLWQSIPELDPSSSYGVYLPFGPMFRRDPRVIQAAQLIGESIRLTLGSSLPGARVARAIALQELGLLHRMLNEQDEALQLYLAGLKTLLPLGGPASGDRSVLAALREITFRIGELQHACGDRRGAEYYYRESLQLDAALGHDQPQAERIVQDLLLQVRKAA